MTVQKLAYNMREARAATGAGENTIAEAIKRGDLETVRVGLKGPGRRILITARSLEKWVTPQLEHDAEQAAGDA
jgi:hypothetical protein